MVMLSLFSLGGMYRGAGAREVSTVTTTTTRPHQVQPAASVELQCDAVITLGSSQVPL